MTRLIWAFLICSVFVLHSLPQRALSAPDMARSDVFDIIKKNSQLNDEQTHQLIDQLAAQVGETPEKRILIRGVLFTHGINVALFVDTDEWFMDATIVDPETGELIEIDNLFTVNFNNGGLKAELAYKWMFTFIPSGMSIQQLSGGVYGRGLGVTMEALLGLEGAWMPGENRPGHLFHAAVKAGLGGGLNFPKMTFKMRRIQ